jgi:hypothetical protein
MRPVARGIIDPQEPDSGPRGGGAQVVDFLPVGLDRRLLPGSSTAVNYALQQNLIRRKIDVAKLFDDTTRAPRRATIGPDRAIGSRQFSL